MWWRVGTDRVGACVCRVAGKAAAQTGNMVKRGVLHLEIGGDLRLPAQQHAGRHLFSLDCASHSSNKFDGIGDMTEMEEGLSLRPMTLRPGGAGPGKNPFASFGRGAGANLAKKVRKGNCGSDAGQWFQVGVSMPSCGFYMCSLASSTCCRPRMWDQQRWRGKSRQEKSSDTILTS